MKTIALLTALLSSLTFAQAADPATHLYKGEIAGVSCAACSKKIKKSLGQLPGVTSIKLLPAEASGVAKIEIASTSAEITKASAIKALGKSAEEYTIITLDEAKQK
jgi:copper chaperone CopZ